MKNGTVCDHQFGFTRENEAGETGVNPELGNSEVFIGWRAQVEAHPGQGTPGRDWQGTPSLFPSSP